MDEQFNQNASSKFSKKEVFSPPDSYFDELSWKIERRIDAHVSNNVSNRERSLWWNVSYAAAASLLLVTIFWFANNRTSSDNLTSDQLLASIPTEDLLKYLEQDEIDLKEIIEVAPELGNNQENVFQLIPQDLKDEDLQRFLEQYDNIPEENVKD